MARDRLSRFLYSLTFYLVPWFNVLGPGSAFKIFAVSHLPDSTVVQCVWPVQRVWPEIGLQGFRNFRLLPHTTLVFGSRSAFEIFAHSHLLVSGALPGTRSAIS